MKFSDLKPEQKALLQSFTDAYRPIQGERSRVYAKIQTLLDASNAGVNDILALLDAGEIVATTSGLSGAQPLTSDEILTGVATLAQALAVNNKDTDRQSYIKAAGISATMP